MPIVKESFKKLVEGARRAGISDEDIRGYISLEKSIKEEHRNVWSQLLSDNDLYMTSIVTIPDKEAFIEEIMGEEIVQEETDQEQENDGKKLSEKSKKLMEKIELLSQKIEQEKSPLKRHILAFKVKMLIAKIQKEIDLQNIKASYQDRREALLTDKENREANSIDNIASLNSRIKALQREMRGNEEYDVESPYFMYPKKYIEQSGGIENLTKKLRESTSQESQQAASKIAEMARKREELNGLYESLRTEQENLEYSEEDYKHDKRYLKTQEMGLVVRQKFNIFSRIGDFFRNIAEQVTEYRKEKSEMKELKGLQKEDEIKLKEAYEREMQRLKEEYAKSKEDMRDYHEGEREAQQSQLGQDMASNFRKKMHETAKVEEADLPQGTPIQDTPQESKESGQEQQPDEEEFVH